MLCNGFVCVCGINISLMCVCVSVTDDEKAVLSLSNSTDLVRPTTTLRMIERKEKVNVTEYILPAGH